MEPIEQQQRAANLQQDFRGATQLPPIGDDEPLVRSYLAQFFLTAEDYKAFTPYVNDQYLKQLFAETKIVNGLGDAERWYALMPPAAYQQLKERIDLDFAFTNKTEWLPDDPVGLDLFVKNVETLIVKVYEINTENVHRTTLRPVGIDINLDGLVANQQQTFKYDQPPLRRVRRHFEFPALDHRGAYVIDFIGNGKSSRVLVRKGRLKYLVRSGVAGQVFTVFDEQNRPQPRATLWMSGRLFTPDKDGTITAPFSNAPGKQPIVLSLDGFSSLDDLTLEAEDYKLAAGIYVDREELIQRRKATVILRPQLTIGQTPVTLKVLEDVRLSIVSTDLEGVETSKEVPDFRLLEDRESTYEFQVPQRLAQIRFQLRAKVQNYSQNKKIDLAAEQKFSLSGIDRTDKTEDLLFARVGEDYVIDLLGRTGESKANRPLQVSLKLRDYTQPVNVTLQSDARGRTVLGPLSGVESVTASGPQGTSHTWRIRSDWHTYPATINADGREPLQIPLMSAGEAVDRADVSLIELRGSHNTVDRFANMALDGALMRIEKLPPGNYSLLLKRIGQMIHLHVTEGAELAGYVMGDYRKLELNNRRPLQLKPIEVGDKTLRVALQNASPLARVHVLATRFWPDYSAYGQLAKILPREPRQLTTPRVETHYAGGRNIGDEYRYIIDRKFAKKFPGNMLERPSLLLNPWAVRSSETGEQLSLEGTDIAGHGSMLGGYGGVSKPFYAPPPDNEANFADLNFLAESSLVLTNLVVDEDGTIEIKRADLGPHQQLLVVAVDAHSTVSRHVALPDAKDDFLDLRLAKTLDPKQHFTQQKQISVLKAGGKLELADITSARLEVYDSVARVHGLYWTLTGDPKLAEFSFVGNWPNLKDEQKRELYRKFASHELHFFLMRRDPDFFRQAILPYLANKKEKQFVDRWLLAADLAGYARPWDFAQLNTFEQILLGRSIAAQRASVATLVKDKVDVLPPDPARWRGCSKRRSRGARWTRATRWALKRPRRHSMRPCSGALRDADQNGVAVGMNPPQAPAPAPAEDAPAGVIRARELQSARGGKDKLREELKHKNQKELPALAKKLDDQIGYEADVKSADAEWGAVDAFADEREKLGEMQQYYRQLDKTMEWVESNYYQLPLEQQKAELIAANAFWNEYAAADPAAAFLPRNLADPTHGFAEMLMALSLVDLPFAAGEHKTAFDGTKMTLAAASPMIVYHEEIRPALHVAENSPVLVSENFFRQGDRYRQVGGEQVDNFVSGEFLVDTVYGCQVVVTNPTSAKQKVDVLLQIPSGAIPVQSGYVTRSIHLDLEPYHTESREYFFYFPAVGDFAHYGVQVATAGDVLASLGATELHVVARLTNIDKQSWEYVSQQGSEADVIEFLKSQNLERVDLERIAWRMQEEKFFRRAISLLATRHVYNHTLWSYAVKHNDAAALRQFLQFADDFVRRCGDWLDSPLLVIDPVVRKTYEQMDYRPLVNARSGQLGRARQILNDRFLTQYQHLLKILSYRRQLDDSELMAVTYYLLLQDRVDKALDLFARVNAERLDTRLQYDYFAAYLDFSKSQPKQARQIAAKYAEYPVDAWRLAFANVVNQADEIGKDDALVADAQDRSQVQTGAAANSPALDFAIEGRTVRLDYQRLTSVRVNYYLMDIELLFSRNPFVQGDASQFSSILPNVTQATRSAGQASAFGFRPARRVGQRQRSGRDRGPGRPPFPDSLFQRAGGRNGGELRPDSRHPARQTDAALEGVRQGLRPAERGPGQVLQGRLHRPPRPV